MKKLISFVLAVMLVIGFVVPVSADHWVDEYVPYQIQNQLQSLNNDDEITRLQFCEDLLRLYEVVNGREMEEGGLYVVPFSDCSSQAPYILATQGIVNGMSEGVFGPNATLTRAQCVAMVKRAMAPTRTGNGSFPDTRGHWAQPEIAWAAENSVVNGFEDGNFHPDWNLTVAQARKILYLAQKQFGWVGVSKFSGGTGNNGGYNGGSFSPTPQQGQGYTNPDGTWDSGNGYYDNNYNNNYNNGYDDGYYNDGYYNDDYYGNDSFGQSPGYNNNYNGGSFSDTPANGGIGGDYAPSSPTNGGGF